VYEDVDDVVGDGERERALLPSSTDGHELGGERRLQHAEDGELEVVLSRATWSLAEARGRRSPEEHIGAAHDQGRPAGTAGGALGETRETG
jgi:hypothetical protein